MLLEVWDTHNVLKHLNTSLAVVDIITLLFHEQCVLDNQMRQALTVSHELDCRQRRASTCLVSLFLLVSGSVGLKADVYMCIVVFVFEMLGV